MKMRVHCEAYEMSREDSKGNMLGRGAGFNPGPTQHIGRKVSVIEDGVKRSIR